MNTRQTWQPFLMVSLALCVGTSGTALSSPLYPIYELSWHLLPSQITYIFVAYMFGCLAALLFLGRVSNHIGYVRTLQLGLLLCILGLGLSAFAPNVFWLSIGRFIIGIASGLINTSAMLGLFYTIPDSHKAYSAQLSSIITVIGFGVGPVIGGFIAQFFAYPLVTPYLPIILLSLLSLVSLFRLKAKFTPQKLTFMPHLEMPETKYKLLFLIIGFSAFSAFGSFSLFASLAPSFIKEVIPWHGPLVSGMTISSILLLSASSQIIAKSLEPHKGLNLGLYTLIGSYVILAICMLMQWSILFFISVVGVGIGHGLTLLAAFSLVNKMTQTENRAAVVSTYLFMAYLGTILPILAVGYLSDHFGMIWGVVSFCLVMGILCLSLLLLHFRQMQQRVHIN
ncbi:MFS transporter [Acinetobacter populi]|uniref:MFS transporter n=2 Tax=Acinetobacter populi TaxID=1582270 RepID=A0A1Z9YWP0_9GAMM|nr:MFS transporter [Acinetobacter populi]OUY06593.1 MFS transporter [Acinetobacter populi]